MDYGVGSGIVIFSMDCMEGVDWGIMRSGKLDLNL